jgi:hypothetical protein
MSADTVSSAYTLLHIQPFKTDGLRTVLRILTCCAGDVQIHLVEINIEVDAEVAEAAGVNGTPTIQMFKVVSPCSCVMMVVSACHLQHVYASCLTTCCLCFAGQSAGRAFARCQDEERLPEQA